MPPEFFISQSVLPFTPPLPFYTPFHFKTIGKRMLSWILYFWKFPLFHLATSFFNPPFNVKTIGSTCFPEFSISQVSFISLRHFLFNQPFHVKTIGSTCFPEFFISQSFLPFTSPFHFLYTFPCQNHRKHMLPWILYFSSALPFTAPFHFYTPFHAKTIGSTCFPEFFISQVSFLSPRHFLFIHLSMPKP